MKFLIGKRSSRLSEAKLIEAEDEQSAIIKFWEAVESDREGTRKKNKSRATQRVSRMRQSVILVNTESGVYSVFSADPPPEDQWLWKEDEKLSNLNAIDDDDEEDWDDEEEDDDFDD